MFEFYNADLHGSAAVAELKRRGGNQVRGGVVAYLHGSAAVAELKQWELLQAEHSRDESPRLRSRGRIEAISHPDRLDLHCGQISTAPQPWPN